MESEVSLNKCNLRETKSFDIAKINSRRLVCLLQGGTNVVAPYYTVTVQFRVVHFAELLKYGKSHISETLASHLIILFVTRRNLLTLFLIDRRFCYFTCVTCKLNNTLTLNSGFLGQPRTVKGQFFFNVYKTDFSMIG